MVGGGIRIPDVAGLTRHFGHVFPWGNAVEFPPRLIELL